MRLVAILAAAVATAAVLAASAAAATTNVSAGACQANGGNRNVPSGSEVVIRAAWGAKNRGLVMDFLNAQTTALTVNGLPVADTGSYYGSPIQTPDYWAAWMTYPTGITLGAGDTMTFHVVWSFSHQLHDGFLLAGDTNHKPVFFEGFDFGTCTVHGV